MMRQLANVYILSLGLALAPVLTCVMAGINSCFVTGLEVNKTKKKNPPYFTQTSEKRKEFHMAENVRFNVVK